jgi:methylenetetrahydrofolate dehydrogenase (NADP+)/methenyltetrahydrofolate cyclohydrolase
MELLDGKLLSAQIKEEIKADVDEILSEGKRAPHLVAVLVGDNPASQSYVRSKVKSCEQVGFQSTLINESNTISEDELLAIVKRLNEDENVDGFIVQLPLPDHIDPDKVTMAIDPRKDVDGFHPINLGRMTIGLPAYLPATPNGILEMLKRYNIETSGKECVVIGRSNIVGTPISILLSRKSDVGNCTVTLCHSRTRHMADHIRRADIIIAAIGKANFVTADMVKKGAVVIDVGINRVDAPERKRGYKLVGDVDFENVAPLCSHITPVPGGVGLMTVVSLLMNTLRSYRKEVYG